MKITKEQFDNLPYDLKKNFIHRKIKRRPLDNIVETGAGALNIDGTRIPVDSPVTINRFTSGAKPWGDAGGEEFDTVLTTQGRWASNFILDESVAERLDNQSGVLHNGGQNSTSREPNRGMFLGGRSDTLYAGDSGGASRFFFQVREQIDEADPIYYCSKVSPKERNAGLINVPVQPRRGGRPNSPDPTGKFPDHDHRENGRNPHPTLKPISLAKYLATLLLPPDAYAPRRILVPFSGVMSEAIGAAQAGWEHIVAIEFMEEYARIGRKRMEYYASKT